MINIIKNYNDFIAALQNAGFSMGGGNSEGIYAIIPWGWNEQPPYETPIVWHTENPETDPWEWRMRVLNERKDIAYSKLFFKKSGFITKEWYPYFLAARRGGISFEEAYENGTISYSAKHIYDAVAANGTLPLHVIKEKAGFKKEDKSAFDRALTELQMRMFLTICGKQAMLSPMGSASCSPTRPGWPSTVFCTTEHFFGEAVFDEADKITATEAIEKIKSQIKKLNPIAEDKKIKKFILG
jgi:hypothetical protein